MKNNTKTIVLTTTILSIALISFVFFLQPDQSEAESEPENPLPITLPSEAEETQKFISSFSEFEKSNIDPVVKEAFKDIAEEVSPIDLLSGAHIVLRDQGHMYEKLEGLVDQQHIRNQTSSHYANIELDPRYKNQYGIDIEHLGHVLFGARPSKLNPNEIQSWLQFEAHGVDLWSLPFHILNYIQHKLYGYQIGPLGISPHSEKYINKTEKAPHQEQYGSEIVVDPNEKLDDICNVAKFPIL